MTLSIRDILNASDSALDDILNSHVHRSSDGRVTLDLDEAQGEEFDALTRAELETLSQRLRNWSSSESNRLDINDLLRRLHDLPGDTASTQKRRSPTVERSPTPAWTAEDDEREFYAKLVKDGGRPLYPIEKITQVSTRPQDYGHILRFWRSLGSGPWQGMFQRQWERWGEFRKWQHDARTPVPPKVDGNSFAQYVKAVKEELAKHGQLQPFELKEDPQQQTALATWMEYLNFELLCKASRAKISTKAELAYDNAWTALQETGKISPSETRESIGPLSLLRRFTDESGRQLVSTYLHVEHVYVWSKSERDFHANIVEWVIGQVPLIDVPSLVSGRTKRKRQAMEDGEDGNFESGTHARRAKARLLKTGQPQFVRRSNRIAERRQAVR